MLSIPHDRFLRDRREQLELEILFPDAYELLQKHGFGYLNGLPLQRAWRGRRVKQGDQSGDVQVWSIRQSEDRYQLLGSGVCDRVPIACYAWWDC